MRASSVRIGWALAAALYGCASIAGFEDLSGDCPPDLAPCTTGGTAGTPANDAASETMGHGGAAGTSGQGGSSAQAASGGAGGTSETPSCRAQPPSAYGPKMARVQRADRSCFFIDTTEVTEGQYAEFERSDDAGVTDAKCSSGTPAPTELCRERAGSDAGIDPALPKTCVDWCNARDFCEWAGKSLCKDDFMAESDFEFACTEGGKPDPYGPNCGSLICSVGPSGPSPAGQTQSCYVQGADETKIRDLIGNVEEWNGWCRDPSPDSPCSVRGGSFGFFDPARCCAEKTNPPRRHSAPTLGFRCCYYPQ